MREVVVIGLGYIGLPTAATLAAHGTRVVGVDVNQLHVDAVNRGEVPFVEPDLGTHVAGAVARELLSAAVQTPASDTYIIAVPTPLNPDHTADLSHVDAATDAIISHLRGGELIVLESTVPPGTTARLGQRILAARPDLVVDRDGEDRTVHIAHCPERVLPGRVMIELITNDRIVGGLTPAAGVRAKELYGTFCSGDILLTDAMTAELSKLTENAFRDVNIAFANELSVISAELGVDPFALIDLANRHPRVNILQPGPGVGGHCIAVDPWFIVSAAPESARLICTAREVNDAKPEHIISQVLESTAAHPEPSIALLGLTFKPDIDDLRESPALEIAVHLAELLPTAVIRVVDPHVQQLPPVLDRFDQVSLTDLPEALESAQVVVLLVDHREFGARPDLRPDQHVIDTRGRWRTRLV